MTATAVARVSAARPTAMPRAGTAVTDVTPGTVPAVTPTRVPATDATPGGANGGYGRSGYGAGGQGNDAGFGGGAGYAGANGRSGGPGFTPEFTPADNDDADDDAPAGTPRPYGRLSIYTLHDDKAREFDRLAERAAEGVRASEPDTLVYVIHVVPKAPMQRIIYEIYRDRGAFLSHERQPHIRQFAADRASCVLATNIIDLRLKYAKVAALGSPQENAASPQAGWSPRAEAAQGNDRYAATTQYSRCSVLVDSVHAHHLLACPAPVGPVLARAGHGSRGELHAGEGLRGGQ